MDWTALGVSLRLSFFTMILLLVIGTPIAYWVAFSRWKFKFLVEAIVALPLVLPPTVLGFYILLCIGPRSPIGTAYHNLTGSLLPFSFEGLLLASVLYSLPFAVQPFASAFGSVDRRLIEAISLPRFIALEDISSRDTAVERAGRGYRNGAQLCAHLG